MRFYWGSLSFNTWKFLNLIRNFDNLEYLTQYWNRYILKFTWILDFFGFWLEFCLQLFFDANICWVEEKERISHILSIFSFISIFWCTKLIILNFTINFQSKIWIFEYFFRQKTGILTNFVKKMCPKKCHTICYGQDA